MTRSVASLVGLALATSACAGAAPTDDASRRDGQPPAGTHRGTAASGEPTSAGDPPPGAPPATPEGDAGGVGDITARAKAFSMEAQASQKLMLHDGVGCLGELDRADATDPASKARRLELRARCEMRADRCEDGKAHYREARRAWYRAHKPTVADDATIEDEVTMMAKQECPPAGGSAKPLPDATMELVQKIGVADQQGDASACVEHGRALKKLAQGTEGTGNHLAAAGLSRASTCAARDGHCTDARSLYLASLRHLTPNLADDAAESAWKLHAKECQPPAP